jgi:hypothetical protein
MLTVFPNASVVLLKFPQLSYSYVAELSSTVPMASTTLITWPWLLTVLRFSTLFALKFEVVRPL